MNNRDWIITPRAGDSFGVDISDEACLQFGFRHGDRVVIPGGRTGRVEGVGSHFGSSKGKDVLWLTLDDDVDVSCYYGYIEHSKEIKKI